LIISTRDGRVRAAVKILGEGNRRQVDRRQAEVSVRFVDGMKRSLAKQSAKANRKDGKIAAGRVAKALRRLEVVLKNKDLEAFVRDRFPLSESELRQWREHCEAITRIKLPKPARRDGVEKQLAAAEAAFLLESHGLPLSVTRRGRFCRLAAVLFGDTRADLHHQCLDAKQARNRV
jgi:hypothetical protein